MTRLCAFDFDGTLVETAALKREAFFEVFPDRHAAIVEAVLTEDPDGSRYDVIPEMVLRIGDGTYSADEMVAAYGARVAERVAAAPEIHGAEAALAWAAEGGVACIFSMTPHAELLAAIDARGWSRFLSDVQGYPAQKTATLRSWSKRFAAAKVIVIGDGVSDEHAAKMNSAEYIFAAPGWPEELMEGARP